MIASAQRRRAPRGSRFAAVVATVAAAGCVSTASAATPTPTEFSTGISGTFVEGITAGPDGNVWFTEMIGPDIHDRVGVIAPSGVVTEFPVDPNAPVGITSGPDNKLWYTLSDDLKSRIGRIDAASSTGSQMEFPFRDGSEPRYITVGPDGNLWFTESAADRIGRMDPQGNLLDEIALPAGSQPEDITVGPDPAFSPSGSIWFTEFGGNRIGRIRLTGPCCVLTEFAAGISPGAGPDAITAAADGNLWFTEFSAGAVARMTPTGTVKEFPLPGPESEGPLGITVGQDGNLWYVEANTSVIGRMALDGTVTGEFQTKGNGYDIAAGPDGNLWAGNYENPATITRINTALDPPPFPAPGQITIREVGPADPYPSAIDVAGLAGTVTDVNVRLTGISHTDAANIDAVLVGPNGQSAKLISDVGSPDSANFNGVAANGITLNVDDEAQFSIPEQLPLLSGVYKPTDAPPAETATEFPAPAPPPPYGTKLAAFDGTDPNGRWKLFVADDTVLFGPRDETRFGFGAIFGGWGLEVETTGPPPPPPPAPPPPATPPDTAAPETEITKQPKRKVKTKRPRAKVKFEFGANEAGATYECRLDSNGFEACASPAKYRLKPGKHTFEVAASDAAGNPDSSPAKVKFKVVRR